MDPVFEHNIRICHRCKHKAPIGSGVYACTADDRREDFTKKARRGECPLKLFTEPSNEPKPEPWGPPLWRELHRRPMTADLSREKEWLDAFLNYIPCWPCRMEWPALLEKIPPDLSSRAAYFAWTVAVHNAVNRKLNKTEMTIEEAAKLHGFALEPR